MMMGKNKLLPLAVTVSALVCLPLPGAQAIDQAVEPELCESFYQDLDAIIDKTSRRDASRFPVTGFPFLRTTRFLEAMRYFVTDQTAWEQFVDLMFQEGMAAITREVGNLPQADLNGFMERWRPQDEGSPAVAMSLVGEATRMAAACADRPMRRLKEMTRFQWLLWDRGTIPSPYRVERKVLGIYPFWTLPIGVAITNYKRRVAETYRRPLPELPPKGEVRRFSLPPASAPPLLREKVSDILDRARQNPLGIPRMEKEQLGELAVLYAPVLEQDFAGDYDIPGTLVWHVDRVGVDVTTPVVYYYVTYALLRGRALLQLNYVIWYTERPPRWAVDIEAGRLHGTTIRITLTPDGEPAMVDVMHNCGCYHFFFPAATVFQSPKTELFREDAFVPQWLPDLEPLQRFTLRIGSGNHLVERIGVQQHGETSATPYKLIPYEQLESLPRKTGGRESVFDPAGLVKGETERLERFLLFSVGIPELGSMRQRGHHGTALVGERFFDDPRLFEKFFLVKD